MIEYYKEEKTYYVVKEICGESLFDVLCRRICFSEDETKVIIKRLLSAINVCHMNGIVHRDLKPENILMPYQMDDYT